MDTGVMNEEERQALKRLAKSEQYDKPGRRSMEATLEVMLARLWLLQKNREGRRVDEWVTYELRGMFGAVNEMRTAAGMPEIDYPSFCRVERLALGHSDYTTKWATYCAELATGRTPIPSVIPEAFPSSSQDSDIRTLVLWCVKQIGVRGDCT